MSVCRVHVVFSTAGFKGREKPCPEARETAALRRGIQKVLVMLSHNGKHQFESEGLMKTDDDYLPPKLYVKKPVFLHKAEHIGLVLTEYKDISVIRHRLCQ